MHTYEYDPGIFARKVTLTAAFCVGIILYAFVNLIRGDMPLLWVGAIVIAGYYVWETFVSIANPSKVEADEKGISFSAYGKSHHYDWADVKKFRCKPLASGTKMYVRVNEAGLFRGRYWVNCYYYSDGEELFRYLFNKEVEVDPDGLKARAVKGSMETAKRKEQGRERKKYGNVRR